MRVAVVLCIVLLITAGYEPVLADEAVVADDPAPDIDAVILAGLENQTVTDEIERVLQDEDTLLSFESACCLAEEQIAGVSHSTYERIKQTYATPERVNNLMEQHIKRDSKVDLTFRGMPFESEAWLVHLIVTIAVTVIIVLAYYAAPYISAWYAQIQAYLAESAEIRAISESLTTQIKILYNDLRGMRDLKLLLKNALYLAKRAPKNINAKGWYSIRKGWQRILQVIDKIGGHENLRAAAEEGVRVANAHYLIK